MPTEQTAAMDEMLTIAPLRWPRMIGIAALLGMSTLFVFTLRMRSHASSRMLVTPESPSPMPTLLCSTSSRPYRSTHAATIFLQSASLVAFAAKLDAVPPPCSIMACVSREDSNRRSTSNTRAPSRA